MYAEIGKRITPARLAAFSSALTEISAIGAAKVISISIPGNFDGSEYLISFGAIAEKSSRSAQRKLPMPSYRANFYTGMEN